MRVEVSRASRGTVVGRELFTNRTPIDARQPLSLSQFGSSATAARSASRGEGVAQQLACSESCSTQFAQGPAPTRAPSRPLMINPFLRIVDAARIGTQPHIPILRLRCRSAARPAPRVTPSSHTRGCSTNSSSGIAATASESWAAKKPTERLVHLRQKPTMVMATMDDGLLPPPTCVCRQSRHDFKQMRQREQLRRVKAADAPAPPAAPCERVRIESGCEAVRQGRVCNRCHPQLQAGLDGAVELPLNIGTIE